VFRHALFATPPEANLSDIPGYDYPEEVPMEVLLTPREVEAAVINAAPYKAAGPDGIPNAALQHALPVILPWLTSLFNNCLRLGYCPAHFRTSTTVVLRKPGKADYADPKSYRPIALLSTIGKALESMVASRLSYLVEAYGLLLDNHVGGRRGRSTKHALHILVKQAHAAWRAGYRVASLLSLDISGAFDNVAFQRLIHNLHKRRVPEVLIQWIISFLTNRRTTLLLQEGLLELFNLLTGIPQGLPLSLILFLFFNADLIDDIQAVFPGKVLVTAYIDDLSVMVWGNSTI
jgi:hypothetical protein